MNKLGVVCIAVALILELLSYWKQISKTLRERNSDHVSSSAYLVKIAKYLVTIVGLAIYANWVGLFMEVGALCFCILAFYIIIRFKPKGWSLF